MYKSLVPMIGLVMFLNSCGGSGSNSKSTIQTISSSSSSSSNSSLSSSLSLKNAKDITMDDFNVQGDYLSQDDFIGFLYQRNDFIDNDNLEVKPTISTLRRRCRANLLLDYPYEQVSDESFLLDVEQIDLSICYDYKVDYSASIYESDIFIKDSSGEIFDINNISAIEAESIESVTLRSVITEYMVATTESIH